MKRRSREKKERKKEGQKTEQRGLTPVGPLLCPFSGGDCSGGNCTSENCSHVCVCFFFFLFGKGGWVGVGHTEEGNATETHAVASGPHLV